VEKQQKMGSALFFENKVTKTGLLALFLLARFFFGGG
jgi:hypothetical protein